MATIKFIGRGQKRQKKWLHEKVLFKRFVFRLSILGNMTSLGYLAYYKGYLTNIFEMVAPILESLFKL